MYYQIERSVIGWGYSFKCFGPYSKGKIHEATPLDYTLSA